MILAIYGSPRKEGISSKIHDSFLAPFSDRGLIVKKIYIHEMDIRPCTGCGVCSEKSCCLIEDQMSDLYESIRQCGYISISSPVYFSSLPGQLKNFIDRCQVLWEEKIRRLESIISKTGFFISVSGGNYKDMFTPSITIIRHFFNTINAGFRCEEFITVSGTDNLSDLSGFFKIAETAGKGAAELL